MMVGQDALGRRVRDQRIRAELSQAQLAYPQLSDSYISLIESGKRIPAPSVVELLARKLGCSPSYLTSGVSDEVGTELRTTVNYAKIALQNGEAVEARTRFAEVLRHPDLPALPDLLDEARWGHALALEACGELETAVLELEGLIARLSPEHDPDRWAWRHIALVRCHRERGDFSTGARIGERALAMLTSTAQRWTDSMVMLGATVLSAYFERGDLARSRQLAEQLIVRAEEVGSARARAAAYWNAGIVADYRGDPEEALRLAERAVALLGESDDARNLPRVREECGRLLLRAYPERAEEARDVLRQAQQDLSGSAASAIDVAECMIDLAGAEIVLGNSSEAVTLALRAIDMLGDAPRQGAAEAYITLGHAYVCLGMRDEAAEALARGAEYLESMHASRKAAQAWFDLAELLGETGAIEARADAYRHALTCVGI